MGGVVIKSIKSKLIVYFSILIIIVSGFFGSISMRAITRAVTKEVQQALELSAVSNAEIIKSRNELNYVYLEGLASREAILDTNNDIENKMEILKGEVKNMETF